MSAAIDLLNHLTLAERIFVYLALSFLVGALLFLIFLLVSRWKKSNHVIKSESFKQRFQAIINDIVFVDDPTLLASTASLQELERMSKESAIAKQVIIDQVIALKKSLSGIAVQNLENVFRLLRLHEFSREKLNANAWEIKAQGIYELAEMGHTESKNDIQVFLHSKNRTVQEEAFVALLKLDKDSPLSFLDDYPGLLSLWLRLRIHHHLSHSDKRALPDFSRWFSNSNAEVVLFAMSMARQFRQLDAAPRLVSMLRDSDIRKANLAITTLGELEVYEYADELIDIIGPYWNDNLLSRKIVGALGKLSNTDSHWKTVARYLQHPDYIVQFEAAQALCQSGNTELLRNSVGSLNTNLVSLIRHVQEPLLQSS
jgi:HEAT repeat protein